MTAAEILDECQPLMRHIARCSAGGLGVERDELLHEMVVEVLKHAPRFDPTKGTIRSFVRWLCRGVVARKCWSRWKRTTIRKQILRQMACTSGEFTDPATICEQRELAELVACELANLSPRERQTITLRYGLDGQGERESSSEFGPMLGTSPGAARQALMTGRRKLNESLRDRVAAWIE